MTVGERGELHATGDKQSQALVQACDWCKLEDDVLCITSTQHIVHITYWCCVDENHQQDHQQHDDNAPNDVPLVVLPDDVLEGLQWRSEPEEGGGRAVGFLQVGVQVGFISCLGSWLQEGLFLCQHLDLQLQLTLE